MCGYSLTGSVREQCLFALYGSGANGKTTFLECILFIMGEYGTDLPFSALEPQRFGCSPGEGVDLPGARLAKSVEIREGRHLDEARIKSWTGGDTITVRPLYKNQFSFRPTHKLWLCFNHRPLISDDTNAMWRRMRLIPFGQTFGPDKIDKNLPNVLQAEASGVLNWMLAGCLSWQKEGLEPPTVVQTATTKYAADSDVLQPFFDERCEIGDRFEVPKGELWTAYQQYAAASRERALDRKVFSERLSNRFGERRTKTVRYWTGIGLRREAVMPVAVGRPLTIDLTGMAADGEDHHTLRLSLEPGEDGDG
jgi:putative DNA primase/helicase